MRPAGEEDTLGFSRAGWYNAVRWNAGTRRRWTHGGQAGHPPDPDAGHRPGQRGEAVQAGAELSGGSAGLLPLPLRGPAEGVHHPGGPGGGGVLRVRHGGPDPHPVSDPQGAGAGEGPGGGPHGGAGPDLLQPGLSEGCPAPRGELCVLRPGGGDGPAEVHDQPGVRAGGGGAGHRPHPARLSPDGGDHQPYGGRPGPAGAGAVRPPAGGDHPGGGPPGPQSVPGGVRLPEHPLSRELRGAGDCPAADDLRGAAHPHLRHGPLEGAPGPGGGQEAGPGDGGGVRGAAALRPHRGPAPGHGGRGRRPGLGAGHEPAGAGGCGLGQDGGGRLRGLAVRPERLPVRPDGPH